MKFDQLFIQCNNLCTGLETRIIRVVTETEYLELE
jgi:hypothetical protein